MAGVAIYLVFLLAGILCRVLAQYDPTEILMTDDGQLAAGLPPSAAHWLGTTSMGRDIFSQLILGVRPSLFVGITTAVAVSSIGTAVGLLSGYFRRLGGPGADAAVRHRARPAVPALRHRAGVLLGPSMQNIVLAVAILLWPNAARVVRAQVLTLMQRGFIEAARVTGAGHARIILVHIAPNVLPLSFPVCVDRGGLGHPDAGQRGLPRLRRFRRDLVGLHAAGRLCVAGAEQRAMDVVRAAGPVHRAGGAGGLLPQPRLREPAIPEAAKPEWCGVLLESLRPRRDLPECQGPGPTPWTGSTSRCPHGAMLGLVGESGCGKTTLARALMGVLPGNARVAPVAGPRWTGPDLSVALSPRDRRAGLWREISFIPQSAMNSLDPVYRLRTQMREVLCRRGGLSRADADTRADALFRAVGLDPARLENYPHQFSRRHAAARGDRAWRWRCPPSW